MHLLVTNSCALDAPGCGALELGGAALVCPRSPLGLHDVWRGNLQVAASFLLMLLMYANLRILAVFCYDTHTHTYTSVTAFIWLNGE